MKAWILIALLTVTACSCGEQPPWPSIPDAERKQIDACSMHRTLRECLWEYPTPRQWLFACPIGVPCSEQGVGYYIRDRARLAGRTD